jgi:hypothetical protein
VVITHHISSVGEASLNQGISLRVTTDLASSGSFNRGFYNQTVPDGSLIKHIGNDTSCNAYTVGNQLTSLD